MSCKDGLSKKEKFNPSSSAPAETKKTGRTKHEGMVKRTVKSGGK